LPSDKFSGTAAVADLSAVTSYFVSVLVYFSVEDGVEAG
jgi:hypothetical protein